MTVESIYLKQKNTWISHILILKMKVTTYLRMMMKIYNKYDAQFLSSNNHEDVYTGKEYD